MFVGGPLATVAGNKLIEFNSTWFAKKTTVGQENQKLTNVKEQTLLEDNRL